MAMDKEEMDILASLAKTLASTRMELDGIRTAFIGVLAAISSDPEMQERLAKAIAASAEADSAHSLNSPMPDEMLQRREDWLNRLMPQQLAQRVTQLRGKS